MVVLPIVDRELRVFSKKGSLYWSRLGFAGFTIVMGAYFMLFWTPLPWAPPSLMSKHMFVTLAVITFLYCFLSGVWVTSDCLSGEKRGNTLGLLFLTDLKGYDVVLGKMAATWLQSVYGVVSVFPILAVPLLMGGVGFAEFCRVMLVLLLTLLLSLSVGIGVSALSRHPIKSAIGVFLVMLFLCAAGPLFVMFWDLSGGTLDGVDLVPIHSLGSAFILSHESQYSRYSQLYWTSVGINTGLILGVLVWTCWVIRRVWRDGETGLLKLSRGDRDGDTQRRDRLGRRLVGDQNPIFWSQSRNATKPRWVMSVFILGALYWLWGYSQFEEDFLDEGNYLVTAFVMQLMIKCWVATEAARRFGDERQSGALELLLCTPIKVRSILQGHVQSFYWQFFLPVVGLLLVDLVFLLEPVISHWERSEASWYWVQMFLAGMILFVLDLYALGWLGMWKGLNARFVNRAVMSNLLTILLIPWLLFLVLVMVIVTRSQGAFWGAGGMAPEDFLLALWFFIGCVSSGGWWYWGRKRLISSLRSLATTQIRNSGKKVVGG